MEQLISVIVPVYKVEQYLPRCLDSIINQTYKNLEIILVDDGSPDNCGAICDQYAAADARIKVIHKANAGVSAARNVGIRTAIGDFLMFVDSDDYIPDNAAQIMYERMQQDGSDMAIGKYTDVYDDGSSDDSGCRWMPDAVYTGRQVLEKMGDKNRFSVGICGRMYRKELFDDIEYPKLICGEDLWVFPLFLEKSKRVSIVAKNTYYYYQRPNSVMHVYSADAIRDHLKAILHMVQRLCQLGMSFAASKWYGDGILVAFWLEDTKEARRLLKEYIDPNMKLKLLLRQSPKTWVLWLTAYVPFVKAAVKWKVNDNKRRREKT